MKNATKFVLVLMAGAVTLTAYLVWYKMVARASADVASLEHELNERTELATRIAAARAALGELGANEQVIRQHFVPETGIVGFIGDLEAAGRAQGATVVVRSIATTTEARHAALAADLELDGMFDAVLRTAGVIEHGLLYVRVTRFALSLTAKDVWHADLSLVVGAE